MSFPGPGGLGWAASLLLFAFAAVVLGELVRALLARRVALWRGLDGLERGLIDLYLGGAAVYLVAALPIDAFEPVVLAGLPVFAGGVLLVLSARDSGRGFRTLTLDLRHAVRLAPLLVLLSALALFAIELATALPVGTGNTYDSSLLALYTSLLVQHHTLPSSFAPYAAESVLYPQATTAWLGWAQVSFGLPPARTSLLVTPLFLGIAPLGGFVLGRRWFGTDRAGAAIGLLYAWLGPSTRAFVGGSNDFAIAFPLVLLVAGQAVFWTRDRPVPLEDAVGWGLLVGYSAALNPVGAEWMLPSLLVVGALARPRFWGAAATWLTRWGAAVLAALVAVVPSLVVLVRGWSSPSFTPGSSPPAPGSLIGLTPDEFFGRIDPFLLRPGDTALSPVPVLRLEIVVLLTLGLAIVLFAGRTSVLGRYLETCRLFLAGGVVAIVALLGTFLAAGAGVRGAQEFTHLSSANELSSWLLNLYAVVAAVPLILLLERASFRRPRDHAPPASTGSSVEPPRASGGGRLARELRAPVVCVVAVALIVGSGIALTATQLPPVLSTLYGDFGNVTADDFSLLEYAGTHLPSGARVLVAPGSVAQFLPGYARDVVMLYPMVPGWPNVNASYTTIVRELTNATLDANGTAALATLSVGFVVVTGASSVLWPAFSPTPLLADRGAFELEFHQGDAYLFATSAA